MINATDIEVKLDTMVLEIDNEKNVHVVNTIDGYMILKAKSIILSMGCRRKELEEQLQFQEIDHQEY